MMMMKYNYVKSKANSGTANDGFMFAKNWSSLIPPSLRNLASFPLPLSPEKLVRENVLNLPARAAAPRKDLYAHS